jgi:hypothetical protein
MFAWLEEHALPCAYKYLLGIDCPLCGSQRATFFLLNGEFNKSFQMYPPLIPVLLLAVLFIAKLILRNRLDQKHIYRFATFVLVLVAANYIIKLTGA